MNKKIAFFAAAFAVAVPVTSILAQEAPAVAKDYPAERGMGKERKAMQGDKIVLDGENQNGSEKREPKIQDRCKNIQTRIETQTKRYENNKQMLTAVYGNMKTRLTRLSTQLASKGANVTKLNEDIAVLDTKISKMKADHDAFVASLRESQATAAATCEADTLNKVKTKINEARKVSETVKADRADIRNFFNTTIKADLMAIRAELEKIEPTTTLENETEEAKRVKAAKVKNGTTMQAPATTTPATTTPVPATTTVEAVQ